MTREEIEFIVGAARQAGVRAVEYQFGESSLRVVFASEKGGDARGAETPQPPQKKTDKFIRSPQMGRFSLSHPIAGGKLRNDQFSQTGGIVGYVTARDVVLPVVCDAGTTTDLLVEDGAVVGHGDAIFRYQAT